MPYSALKTAEYSSERRSRRDRRSSGYQQLAGSCCGRKLSKETVNRARALVARGADFIERVWFEDAEMLDEVDDSLDLDQRSSRHVRKAPELLRTATAHAFGQIQRDAIAGTTPLIRKIAFGIRQSLDEGSRQHRQSSRMLVSLQIFEQHVARVISDKDSPSPNERSE